MDNDAEGPFRSWLPRDILRRTNWLYRVNVLRPHDHRESAFIWELVTIFRAYATQFLLWAYSLTTVARNATNVEFASKLQKVITVISSMIELLWSEGYCYFLEFLEIMYYPVTN